jgi:phosphohistidine phosphatase SixA
MREPRDKEHQFGRFVARIGGAMTEIHSSGAQRACATLNGRADAFGRANSPGCTNGLRGCVG